MTDKITQVTSVVSTFSASYGIMLNNPMLIAIAVISAIIGIWNAVVHLDKNRELGRNITTYDSLFTGAWVGAMSAPMLTMLLIVFADPLLNKYMGISIQDDKQIFLYLLYSLAGLLFGRKLGHYALNYKIDKRSKND